MAKKGFGYLDKTKSIDEFVEKFNKKYNSKDSNISLVSGDKVTDFEPLPTGFPGVDIENLGIGGLPRGGFSMLFGPESIGKTSFYLKIIDYHVNILKNKEFRAAVIELEQSINGDHLRFYDVANENIFVVNPTTSEEAFIVATEMIRSGHFDLIVMDSIATLISKNEYDLSEGEDGRRAAVPGQMQKFLNKNAAILRKLNRTAFLFINQERDKMDKMNPYDTEPRVPGGRALPFRCVVILWMKYLKKKLGESDSKTGGKEIKVITKKAKCGGGAHEHTQTILTQHHGKGYVLWMAHFTYLLKRGTIVQNGKMYKFEDEKIYDKKFYKKDFSKLFKKLRKKLESLYKTFKPLKEKMIYEEDKSDFVDLSKLAEQEDGILEF